MSYLTLIVIAVASFIFGFYIKGKTTSSSAKATARQETFAPKSEDEMDDMRLPAQILANKFAKT